MNSTDRSATWRFDTQLVHAGEPSPRPAGAVAMPLYQSSTFEHGPSTNYHDVKYMRLSNTPNHDAVHAKLAALEGAEAALVTASGMAAISAALLSVLQAGDHVLAQDCLYGGTHTLLTADLARLGITVSFVDPTDPAAWATAVRSETRAFYVETISNPLLQLPDFDAVVAFCRARGLVSLIDNTFASPLLYQPPRHGFDLSLHSATKYLNGHTDLVAGAIIGSALRVRAAKKVLDHFGGSLDPHGCWLLHRGMKTLGLRMRQQCATALALAQWLEAHPAVARVHHPGLASSPSHVRALAALQGGLGAVVSFEPAGGVAAADAFLRRTVLAACAPSLGGVESLVTRPATTSHLGMPAEARRRSGIADALVRVSVGIEDVADLQADFAAALHPPDAA